MSIISTENLIGGYFGKTVLDGLDMHIEKGHFTAIIGPNGSGKSTLLRHLVRELRKTSGRIIVSGTDIEEYTPLALAGKIAFTAQNNRIDADFTVAEYVALGRYPSHDVGNRKKVIEALERVGIADLGKRSITSLSGGELQLAAIARALGQESDVLLLDEPVSALDIKHQLRILELLSSLVREGRTVVAVLHDLDMTLRYADECILVKDGKTFRAGSTDSVITEENIRAVYGIDCTIESVKGRRIVLF